MCPSLWPVVTWNAIQVPATCTGDLTFSVKTGNKYGPADRSDSITFEYKFDTETSFTTFMEFIGGCYCQQSEFDAGTSGCGCVYFNNEGMGRVTPGTTTMIQTMGGAIGSGYGTTDATLQWQPRQHDQAITIPSGASSLEIRMVTDATDVEILVDDVQVNGICPPPPPTGLALTDANAKIAFGPNAGARRRSPASCGPARVACAHGRPLSPFARATSAGGHALSPFAHELTRPLSPSRVRVPRAECVFEYKEGPPPYLESSCPVVSPDMPPSPPADPPSSSSSLATPGYVVISSGSCDDHGGPIQNAAECEAAAEWLTSQATGGSSIANSPNHRFVPLIAENLSMGNYQQFPICFLWILDYSYDGSLDNVYTFNPISGSSSTCTTDKQCICHA